MAIDRSGYFTHLHPEKFDSDWRAFYDRIDALTVETRRRVEHVLDLAYGDHPSQKLDVYVPGKGANRPIFVFLHGGGFIEGHRGHYGYVAGPLAEQGILTVAAGYRLAPESHYPDQPEDVRDVLRWIVQNIQEYGGDPGRIFVGGHSAGGILSAHVALQPEWLEEASLPADVIAGCVPISAPFDARDPAIAAYLAGPELAREASPLHNVETPPARTLIAVGAQEESFLQPSEQFGLEIFKKQQWVRLIILQGMGHADTALALGDEKSDLVGAILDMIQPTGS